MHIIFYVSNKEQFTVYLKWVDENQAIRCWYSYSLVKAIIDVTVCRVLNHGASNTSGSKCGVVIQI